MTREDIIDKYFLNLSLHRDYPDIYYVRKSILRFLQQQLTRMRGSILDVGCGIMPYRELILRSGQPITSYTGLDFEQSIETEYALGKPDLFWKGDLIPLESGSMDTIIATELFEHCPDPLSVMREMRRVLKTGGSLIFTVPFLWNLHTVPHDEYRYTPYSLKRLLAGAGFSRIECTPLGGWDASLAQMIGIWFQQRPMAEKKKKWLAKIVLPLMKKLIKEDAKFTSDQLFKDGGMITGIGGTALAT